MAHSCSNSHLSPQESCQPSSRQNAQTSPRIPSTRRRPHSQQLPQQHHPPQVIRIVRRQALQLLPYRHHTLRIANPRTRHHHLQPLTIAGYCRRILRPSQKSPANILPSLRRIPRKPLRGMFRIRRSSPLHPIQRNPLPKRHVPHLLVNRVRHQHRSRMGNLPRYRLQYRSRRSKRAVADQCLPQFIHPGFLPFVPGPLPNAEAQEYSIGL